MKLSETTFLSGLEIMESLAHEFKTAFNNDRKS